MRNSEWERKSCGQALFRADALSVPVPLGGCYSALTRRCADLFRGIVNCAPAKCCVWPDIDRQGAAVRAGAGGGAWVGKPLRLRSATSPFRRGNPCA